jgi:hypothetical protein
LWPIDFPRKIKTPPMLMQFDQTAVEIWDNLNNLLQIHLMKENDLKKNSMNHPKKHGQSENINAQQLQLKLLEIETCIQKKCF